MGSCEDEEAVSGGFSPYLIDGLRGYADSNGDGIVTAEEAFVYAELRRFSFQTPTIYDGYPGELALTTNTLKKSSSSHTSTQQQASYTDSTTEQCRDLQRRHQFSAAILPALALVSRLITP